MQVDQLVAVTGVDRDLATNLLEACGGDLEMAVNMHMEDQGGGGGAGVGGEGVGGADALVGEEDEVRAPIPQRQEVGLGDMVSSSILSVFVTPNPAQVMVQPGYEGYALASRARGGSRRVRFSKRGSRR